MSPSTLPRAVRFMIGAAAILIGASPAAGQLRVVNYNCAALDGDMIAFEEVLFALMVDDIPGYATAPAVIIFQEVENADVADLGVMLNNVAPGGTAYVQGTYTNNGEDPVGGAQAMFYRADLLGEDVSAHADIFTGAGRRADRWRLTLDGYTSAAASFYVYSAHLKASTGGTNEQERLDGVIAIRSNADALPAGTHILYGGDFNLYNNGEPAYTEFLSAGNGQAFDPLGSGSWAGSGNAIKHTQSPLMTSGVLVGGGMDDRFDFQLHTAAFADGAGLTYLSGTCRALGNDGDHYDEAINTGNNSYYSDDIPASNVLADMLFVASDHVPVICEYRLPGRLSASLPASFGRVIQNSTQSISLTLQNTAPAVVAAGAETIQFSATAGGALTGAASGTLAPLAAPTLRSFTINTTVFGNVIGSVQTTSTSQGAGGPVNAVTSGTIVRAANPSFSGSSDVDNLTFEWVVNDDSGTAVLAIPIHNLGYDTFQALLDVDAVSFVTAPLSISGALPVNIGASSGNITLHYDTNAATPGDHEHALAVMVSDENIPGATTRFVFLTLDVHVQSEAIPGDVDGDGDVDFSDLLALLSAWGTCPPDPQPCPADFDNSGAVDFGDLLILLAGWSV